MCTLFFDQAAVFHLGDSGFIQNKLHCNTNKFNKTFICLHVQLVLVLWYCHLSHKCESIPVSIPIPDTILYWVSVSLSWYRHVSLVSVPIPGILVLVLDWYRLLNPGIGMGASLRLEVYLVVAELLPLPPL